MLIVLMVTAHPRLTVKVLWKFLKTEKPLFETTSILVHMIMGHFVHDVTYETLGGTCGNFKNLMSISVGAEVPPSLFIGQVDVRDLARIHIFAMTHSSADGK